MAAPSEFLPQQEGYLPKWLLLVSHTPHLRSPRRTRTKLIANLTQPTQVSLISLLNSVQAYTSPHYTRRIYLRSPSSVTHLSARTFGTWTAISALVRLYAAYDLSNPRMYELAFLTYAVAWVHFVTEWLIYGTAGMGAGLASTVCVSSGTLFWMWNVWGDYVVH